MDRAIRVLVGIVLLAGALMVPLPHAGQLALGVVGVIALVTAAVGFCPLYILLGINTCATVHHHGKH
jgi:hypothetical protein